MSVVPIILAAGASPRLGFPKALARCGGRTAIEIALENCSALAAPVLVLGSDAEQVRAALPSGACIVVNQEWRAGQLSSLLAGLEQVPAASDFMLYLVDYPLLTPAVMAQIVEGFEQRAPEQSIAAPIFRRRGGHPVIFAAQLRCELQRAGSARDVVYRDAARVKYVPVGTDAIWRDLESIAPGRTVAAEVS